MVRINYPNTKLLLMEASPQQEEKLHGVIAEIGNAEYRIAVLAEKAGNIVKFYQGGDTGNSMFLENTKFYENDVPVERNTSTLDVEIAESFIKDTTVDLIKADVQGAELMVLAGATKALAQATFVQLEGSTVEFNQGGACFYEIEAFLRSHGFFLYDFGDLAYNPYLFKTQGVGQFDVLFIKPTSPRLPKYFREKQTTFCGQNKQLQQQQTSEVTNQLVDRSLSSLQSHTGSGSWMSGFLWGSLVMAFFNILVVLVCGSMSSKQGRRNESRHQQFGMRSMLCILFLIALLFNVAVVVKFHMAH